MDKPVLTAFITVTICEESLSSTPAPVTRPAPSPLDPQPSQAKNDFRAPVAPASMGQSILGMENLQVDFSSKDGSPGKNNADGEDEFGCRIVEEPESPTSEQ